MNDAYCIWVCMYGLQYIPTWVEDPFSGLLLTDHCITTHLITVNYIHLFTIRYFLQTSQPDIIVQYSWLFLVESDRYTAFLFLSGPSHPSDRMRLGVSILTCGSVSVVGWSCRCCGCCHGFNSVFILVCLSLWYFFYKFVCVMACANVLIVFMYVCMYDCMYVVVWVSLCMISVSVFVCWDDTYASWVRLCYNISVVDQVVDFSSSSSSSSSLVWFSSR